MTFDEAKSLLASVAVLDNRNVDGTTVSMWQTILEPYTFAEAMWALREFARTNSQDYLRPAHLIGIINRKRSEHADMNPERAGQRPDAWLGFEVQVESMRRQNRELRDSGARLAVEAMEDSEMGEGSDN